MHFDLRNQFISVAISCLFTVGPAAAEEIAKQGPIDFVLYGVGETTILAAAQDTLQINYVVNGMRGEPGQGINGVASMQCVGAITALEGKFDNESGLCKTTYPDKSSQITQYSGTGILGGKAEGTWSFLSGSGQFEGITGGGTYWRIPGPAPSEDRTASRSVIVGSYELP